VNRRAERLLPAERGKLGLFPPNTVLRNKPEQSKRDIEIICSI
jgi:hypothetical protein